MRRRRPKRRALAAAQAQVAAADAERAAANELLQKLASLNERLSDGERMIAELEAEHTRDLAELESILAAAGLDAPPQVTEVEAAQAAAERAAQLATLAGTLEQLGHRAAVARDGMLEADSEIMALGSVSYDEEAQQKAVRSARCGAARRCRDKADRHRAACEAGLRGDAARGRA